MNACSCLPHPVKDQGTVCGYVEREYGRVVPCSKTSCSPACSDDDLIPGIRVEVSTGTGKLPDGFGKLIQTSDRPTDTKGAADFVAVQKTGYKVWEIMIIPMILLLVILLMA
jgi:hypothetical protein